MLCEPVVHALVVNDDDISVAEPLHLLLGSEFAPSESAEVMNQRDRLRPLQTGNVALNDKEFFERILDDEHIPPLQLQQQVHHAEEFAEEGSHLPPASLDSQIGEAHTLHQFVHVSFRRVGRVHADVTVHIFQEFRVRSLELRG